MRLVPGGEVRVLAPEEEEVKNEADVKKAVKKILTEAGWFLWMPPANAYGRSGIADINAVKDGLLMVVETKFSNNKPTPLQARFLVDVRGAGGIAAVVSEKNFVKFESAILGHRAMVATTGIGLEDQRDWMRAALATLSIGVM